MEHIFVDTTLGYSLTDEQAELAQHIAGNVRTLCKAIKKLHDENVIPTDERYRRYHKLITEYQLDLSDLVGMHAAGMTIAEIWNGVKVIK